jgi:hypothetical protein
MAIETPVTGRLIEHELARHAHGSSRSTRGPQPPEQTAVALGEQPCARQARPTRYIDDAAVGSARRRPR